MKALVRRALNRLGVDVVRVNRGHGDHATHLRSVLLDRRVDGAIDVGANTGQFGAFLRRIGFRGPIVSFEPVLASFAQLEKARAADAAWTAHCVALGDRSEARTMNVYSGTSQFSSLLEANAYAKEAWSSSLADVEKREVLVRRLDDLYDETVAVTGAQRLFLKLDTQGFDLQVLHGAPRALRNVEVIQVEVSFIPLYEAAPTGLDLLADLQSRGFHVSGMFPLSREPSLAVVEFDCVLVRRHVPANPS